MSTGQAVTIANLAVIALNVMGAFLTAGIGLFAELSLRQFIGTILGLDVIIWLVAFTLASLS